jgi:DNA-directed RNA polymerase specialized sigma24 family protein
MIRMAVVERNDQCWEAMVDIYRDHVHGWCRRAGAHDDDLDGLATDTWERFWRSYTPEKLAGAGQSTAAVLTYLRMCAYSVVLDEARRRGRQTQLVESSQDTAGAADMPRGGLVEAADAPAFWALVDGFLRDDRERLVVRLTYANDLRPAEIQQLHPELFPSVTDVYKISRNLLDRMRRSPALSRWLGFDVEQ